MEDEEEDGGVQWLGVGCGVMGMSVGLHACYAIIKDSVCRPRQREARYCGPFGGALWGQWGTKL